MSPEEKVAEHDRVKAMFPDDQQYAMCNELVQMWINYTHEHPELQLGTQMRAFAINTALAMRICDLKEDEFAEALDKFSDLLKQVYFNAEENIKAATIQ
jgi:hypothetical protein